MEYLSYLSVDMQVIIIKLRAFGSTLARRRLELTKESSPNGSKQFDLFILHFNEEFTALDGALVKEQAQFTNSAVQKILSLYLPKPPFSSPSSVLLIGHSMGGMVARTMFTLPEYQPNSVNTLLTLGTPHLRPVIALDPRMQLLYKDVNKFWKESYRIALEHSPLIRNRWQRFFDATLDYGLDYCTNTSSWICSFFHQQSALRLHKKKIQTSFANVSLISISGGHRDIMVPGDLSQLHEFVPTSNGISVFTSSIRDVWLYAGHTSLVWCRQLVQILNKILIDIARQDVPERTLPLQERMIVFQKHLGQRYENENGRLAELPPLSIELQPPFDNQPTMLPLNVLLTATMKPILFDMTTMSSLHRLFVLTNLPITSMDESDNHQTTADILVCKRKEKSVDLLDASLVCRSVKHRAFSFPGAPRFAMQKASLENHLYALHLSAEEFNDGDALALIQSQEGVGGHTSSSASLKGFVMVSQYETLNSIRTISLPTLLFGRAYEQIPAIIDSLANSPPISRPSLLTRWHFSPSIGNTLPFHLSLKRTQKQCSTVSGDPLWPPVVIQHTSYGHEDKYLLDPKDALITFQGTIYHPWWRQSLQGKHWTLSMKPYGLALDAILDSNCEYVMSVRIAWKAMAGAILRRHGVGLLALIQYILIASLFTQLSIWREKHRFPSLTHVLVHQRMKRLPRHVVCLFIVSCVRLFICHSFFNRKQQLLQQHQNPFETTFGSSLSKFTDNLFLGPNDHASLLFPFIYLLAVGGSAFIAIFMKLVVILLGHGMQMGASCIAWFWMNVLILPWIPFQRKYFVNQLKNDINRDANHNDVDNKDIGNRDSNHCSINTMMVASEARRIDKLRNGPFHWMRTWIPLASIVSPSALTTLLLLVLASVLPYHVVFLLVFLRHLLVAVYSNLLIGRNDAANLAKEKAILYGAPPPMEETHTEISSKRDDDSDSGRNAGVFSPSAIPPSHQCCTDSLPCTSFNCYSDSDEKVSSFGELDKVEEHDAINRLSMSFASSTALCDLFEYQFSILCSWILLLAVNVPLTLVWIRDLSVGWYSMRDDSVLFVAPLALLGGSVAEEMISSKMIFRYVGVMIETILLAYIGLWGSTHVYLFMTVGNVIALYLLGDYVVYHVHRSRVIGDYRNSH